MLVCSWLIATAGTLASAGEPSAEDLIALAPVARSTDAGCKSIEAGIRIFNPETHIEWKLRVLYRAPGRYALILRDGTDDTPVFWVADHQVLVYDPVVPAILYGSGVRTDFTLFADAESFKCSWSLETGKTPLHGIVLDIKSLFSGPAEGDEVAKTGDGAYRLTRTKGACSIVAHVDTGRGQSYTNTDIRFRHTGEVVSVEKLVIDGALGDEEFAFPEKDRLAAKVAVKEYLGGDLDKNMKDILFLTRSLFKGTRVRLAAKRPELRSKMDFSDCPGIDWDAVKKSDAIYSHVLKDLIAAKPEEGVPAAAR
jgi:hypothetical protein